MRVLVVNKGLEPLDFSDVGEAAVASHRLRDEQVSRGKIIEHAHIAGFRAHMWIYEVDSADELDRVVSGDPMASFAQGDPMILPLTSYERMEERERSFTGSPPGQNTSHASAGTQAEIVTDPTKSRFLVVAYGVPNLDIAALGDAPVLANRYRERLFAEGKISVHAHIAGHHGHLWIYHVDSVDELDRVIANDPMSSSIQGDPLILPLCSYQRMHEREQEMFSDDLGS